MSTDVPPADRPLYKVQHLRNIRIPMADGVTLAADLYMPEVAAESGASLGGQVPHGKFPAIIEYTPYHKNNNAFYGPRATRYPYFASHGYVFVNVDIRGLGDSDGFNTSLSSEDEIRDNLEVIRWCARQPWCDGNVGMIGISYTAGVCYDAARAAPPELKAVVLCQMTSDWYDGMACPGGTPRPFAYENYAPLMAAYNLAPPNPDLVGADWSRIWQARLDSSVPWSISWLAHLLDGPFWESKLLRGHEDRVTAATYFISGWCDWYPDDFMRVFGWLQCPKRALIGPWTHNYPENGWPLPRINDRYESLRWFDKYLKGIDTDPQRPVDREPPVTLFVREFTPPSPLRRHDAGYFQYESEWPTPREAAEELELFGGGRLVAAEDAAENADSPAISRSDLVYRPDVGIAAGRYVIGQLLPGWGMPDDQRLDEGLSLVFSSEPFAEPREMVGVPVARLAVSSTTSVAFLSVKLCDVAPDGTSVLISKGVLNLTHRESRGDPSKCEPKPLIPGEIYEIELPLLLLAYRMARGHRLRVMIAAADFQNAWPTPLPHTLSLHHSGRHRSSITIPFTRAAEPPLPEPQFLPSDFPPLPPDQIPTPQYSVTRDLIANTMTVDIRTQSGVGINRSHYIVNVGRPAEAVVHSDYEFKMNRAGMAIVVRSNCVTRSDEQSFHHIVDVNITINEHPHWQKQWSISVPRQGC